MYDINGSANFFNMTDYGIVVDRQDEMGIVYIHVEKTRFRNFREQRETRVLLQM